MNKVIVFILLFLPFSLTSLEVQIQNPISDFLRSSKLEYERIIEDANNSQIIHFVMGNESADLDSIISSITYAYLLKQESPSQQTGLYIPLMNIFREEIVLRKDVLYVFDILNIAIDDLVFLDDNVPLNELLKQKRLSLNLVDHNVLKPSQAHLSDAVERIVDHHADENIQYPLISGENKLIAVAGSAATLIAEKILSNQQVRMHPEFAALLLAPILIDTSNLKSAEKTTEKDIKVAEQLQNLTSSLPQGFYHNVLAAKNDISNLSPLMLLSKDFKEYLDDDILYGITSLPPTVQWDVQHIESLKESIQKFASERNLAFLILLMSGNTAQTKRKIWVYSHSRDLLQAFDTYVKTDDSFKNTLFPCSFLDSFPMAFYRTEKPLARKELQPLFRFSKNPEIKAQFTNAKS